MKHFPFLALCLLLSILFISCYKNREAQDFSTSKDLPNYFNYFPPKTIAVGEPLMFDFASTNVKPVAMGHITEGFIDFEPSIDFTATWTTPTTLKVSPTVPLKYDKNYNVKIKLNSIFNWVPKLNESVVFKLRTQQLNFTVTDPTINFSDIVGDESITVSGKVIYPIGFDTASIIKAMRFSQAKNDYVRVSWNSVSLRELSYQVSNVMRYDNDTSALNITWDGSSFTKMFKGSHNVTIPKRADFEVTDIRPSDNSDQKIEVYFSNIVKYNQVLDGLFTVKNLPVKFKTEIESNKVTLFPEDGLPQDIVLLINKSINDKTARTMKKNFEQVIHFDSPRPEVKDLRAGVIIPESDKMLIPFEAKNLKYVDVNIRKIFQNNVIHFLRHYDLETNYRVRHVGRTVYNGKIDLSKYAKESNTNKFVNYSIDLKKMADLDPGCIYKINITFRPSYVNKKDCTIEDRNYGAESDDNEAEFEDEEDYDYYDYYAESTDPCSRDYYEGSHFIEKTIMMSNIGMIAKAHEKSIMVICTDIMSAEALPDAEVTVYDQQKQAIFTRKSDGSGLVTYPTLPRAAKFIIVKKGKSYSYLDLGRQDSNSLTEFDVDGVKKIKTIDGFIYTDRGVYRPGDSIYLNTIVVDAKKSLPKNHPIHVVVTDVQGHIKYDNNIVQKNGPIFSCIIPTNYNDPTGNWNVSVTVGNIDFNHTLKVETIKPNRLKIAYDKHDEIVDISKGSNSSINFKSRWLHGAPAQDLKAEVDVKISEAETSFKTFNNYQFQDPMRSLEGSYERAFDGNLNAEGKASYKLSLGDNNHAPGFVQLNIKTRVYEKSGNFSEDYFAAKASPYTSYVGINVPSDRWDNHYIKVNTKVSIPFISLDKDGRRMPNRKLSFGLYTMHPSWWYEENESSSLKYNSGEHIGSIEKRELTTDVNGAAHWDGAIRNTGYYMIRICDEVSGHCSGQKFYVEAYEQMQNEEAKGILNFTSDKKSYANGEPIKLKIPSNENSNILIALENSTGVLNTLWVKGQQGFTHVAIPATSTMHPNVYVHATLIQKYKGKNNDLPLRMYGVIPINVLDPATMLQPQIVMPASLEPDKTYSIGVKEKSNKPFAYTLAIVDEGLLDITRFKTPDPHKHFYAKQALDVRTWDIFDQVAATFNGKIYKAISIGGDASIDNAASTKRAERFKPVVKFYGPFYSNGGVKQHKIKISNYVGAVRAMVVACNDQSFGSAEVTVPVKKPLMVQSTLPRLVYVGDEFTFSTDVFAMKNDMKTININVEATPNVSLLSNKSVMLNLKENSSDEIAEFKMKALKIGKCQIKVTAKSGKTITTEKIEIDIINPNPIEYAEVKSTVEKNATLSFETFGSEGTNKAVLELSNTTSFNSEKRLQYLIRYPYGCLEQTTSSVFPQLYVGKIIKLDDAQIKQIPLNIKGGIERLASFQTFSGAFAYWPGKADINKYANTYAGHFLLEARANGYTVPNLLISKWLEYQTSASNNYTDNNNYENNYDQAYRLYTLALAGVPNKGAMNVLKLKTNLDEKTKNMLACAYALTDIKSTALQLFNQAAPKATIVCNTYTFNSSLVEMSIKSMAMHILNLNNQSSNLNNEIATCLGSDKWYSTHEISLALMALANHNSFALNEGITATYTFNGKNYKVSTNKPMTTILLPIDTEKNYLVQVNNLSKSALYAKVTYSGSRPIKANTKFFADNLLMSINYFDQDNKKLDITNLPQGQDFYALIKMKKTNPNLNYYNLALDYLIPTGWEINNERMTGQVEDTKMYSYQNIRDNAAYTFFDMSNNENISIKIKLTASYKGHFFFPATLCGAMYDHSIKASNSGYWVTVTEAENKEAVACK